MSLTNFGTWCPPYHLHTFNTNLISKLHSSYTWPWVNSRKHFSSLLNNLRTTSSSHPNFCVYSLLCMAIFFLEFCFYTWSLHITLPAATGCDCSALHKYLRIKKVKEKTQGRLHMRSVCQRYKSIFSSNSKRIFWNPTYKLPVCSTRSEGWHRNEMESCGTRFYSFSN